MFARCVGSGATAQAGIGSIICIAISGGRSIGAGVGLRRIGCATIIGAAIAVVGVTSG